MRKTVAVIPVRAGSRRLKNKNILPFGDSNLLVHKIRQLKKVEGIEVVVSSDSPEMLRMAEAEGVGIHVRSRIYADEVSAPFGEVVANDLMSEVSGKLVLSVYSVHGGIKSKRDFPVRLAPNSAAVLETIPVSELSTDPKNEFLYLEFEGEAGGRAVTCTNECFLAKYKDYELDQPQIRHRLFKAENGTVQLELSTDKPAFYVFAEFEGIQAVFSDNSFTLLPDHPRIVTLRTEDEYTVFELEPKLVIRHLRGSYSE